MDKAHLSEEQKRRIEENKRKALAKRQEKSQGQSETTFNPKGSSVTNNNNIYPSTSYSQTSKPSALGRADGRTAGNHVNQTTASTSKTAKLPPWVGAAPYQNKNPETWLNKGKPPTSNQKSGIGKAQFYGKAQKSLKGTCVLISKDRFEVNIGFNDAIVAVFKTINSRVYDAASKKWNFSIQDHETLLKAVKGLHPAVQVEPLPRAVLQVFGPKVKRGGGDEGTLTIPQADLSQVDSVLVTSLMPFQREGVNFGVHLNGRVLIADDMGLGKTLQAICLACFYRSKWPLLVVTPSSVRFDWAQQFKRWLPSLDPARVQVSVSGRDDPVSGLVNITSYDLLSRKQKELAAARFRIIIMDESHSLKNAKAVRTKAALPLLQSAEHVVLLSGTPALSRPSELYTQIVAVRPRMFKFHDFGVRYCEGKEQPWGWDYTGCSNMGELQLLMEEKVMIRRMKHDVLSQLPPKRRQVVVLDPVSVASSRSLFHASKMMQKKLSGVEKRGALLQYFHETCKVKLAAVRSYVLDMLAAEKKFLIFAHHQEMLDAIEDAVNSENVQYIRIDGSTPPEQRNILCSRFQSKEEVKVAVLSITAANAGLNLAAAAIVVFAELFWNPGILVQAEDRVHRLGQQNSVLVYYLVAQKTADDHIWPLVQSKLQVLGKAGLAGDDFSETDTTHARDPLQKRILDMFEESFIDNSKVEAVTDDQSTTSAAGQSPESSMQTLPSTPPSKLGPGPSTPRKLNPGSFTPSKSSYGPSPSKRRKVSPMKGQRGIGQFFATDKIVSTSPVKSGSSHIPQQSTPRREERMDTGNDVDSAEWDTDMGEEALAALAADVDWDDDF